MDINNLIAFIEVANKKSFSRSAESLKLTQPAVSKRVAALESELSTKLFDRVGRTIHLTEAGRVLLPSARQISAELSRIENVICNLGDEVSGTLCIGTTEYIATHFMPDTLKTFHKNYPKVALELKFANSQETLQALESGVLELALCSLPEKELRRLAPKLNQDPIWSDNLVFVASTDHPLTKSDYVDLTGLANYPAILPYAPSLSRFLIDEAFNQSA